MTTTEKRLPADDGTKPTNPKDAIGTNKLPLHLWPTTASALGCVALAEGMLKYGRTNWREAGVRASIYVDAAKRHLDAWFEGEQVAPDSGVPHLGNALACIAIIVDAQAAGKLIDDRAYNGAGYRALVEELTPIVAQLRAQHADKSPRHYTIADAVQQDGAVGHRNANPAAPDLHALVNDYIVGELTAPNAEQLIITLEDAGLSINDTARDAIEAFVGNMRAAPKGGAK
jgi:hypothetical protein